MAHEVRLNCFAIKLKKPRLKAGMPVVLTTFDKFETDDTDSPNVDFIDFFKQYMNSFDEGFYVQERTGKALSLMSSKVKFASERRLIYGTVEGGDTEIGGKIKKVTDASDENFVKVTKDDVHSIEYFFLLWLPTDCNVGIMIIQGISDKSITETFKFHFMTFAKKHAKNWSLVIEKFVPEEIMEQMEKEGTIDKITISKNEIPVENAERLLNGIKFDDSGNVKIEIKISGLGKWSDSIKEAMRTFRQEKKNLFFTQAVHEELGIDENSDLSVEFERNGKKASAKMSKKFELSPYIYVDESYITRESDTNLPTNDSVEKYVLEEFFPLIQSIVLDKT